MTAGSLQDLCAVFLVGGMGTRLRSVISSAPKPLASVGDKSFLHLLLRQVRNQGIQRVVLCTGYRAEQIEAEFGSGSSLDIDIKYSHESTPLGTAGAVKLAQPLIAGSSEFLVLNGDSLVQIDFGELLRAHHQHRGIATVAVRRVDDAARYGTVEVNGDGRVTKFLEKTGKSAPGLVNAGVYLFTDAIFDHIPEGRASLETDVFPAVVNRGIYTQEQHGVFIDIGTPEDYARAQQMFESLNAAASGRARGV